MLKIDKSLFERELADYMTKEWKFMAHGRKVKEIADFLNGPQQLTVEEVYSRLNTVFRHMINIHGILRGLLEWLDKNNYYEFKESK